MGHQTQDINKLKMEDLCYTNYRSSSNRKEQCYTETNLYLNPITNQVAIDNNNSQIDYFLPDPNKEADRRTSVKITKQMHYKFADAISGIRCFEGKVS